MLTSPVFKPPSFKPLSSNPFFYKQGFTLIELIVVLVVVGILAAFSTQFIVTSADSYQQAQQKSRLLTQAQASVAQLARYLRSAVPSSVRISASGQCIEFMPLSSAGYYDGDVASASNLAPLTSQVITAPFTLDVHAAEHVLIHPLTSSDIYTTAQPSARASVASVDSLAGEINLASAHRFLRNASQKRFFLAEDPKRACVVGQEMRLLENYGLDVTALTDIFPSGNNHVIATGVEAAGQAFELESGTQNRNTVVTVSLRFVTDSVQLPIRQQVFIRNVP